MKHKSPSKTLYDVKRITRFLRKKNTSNKVSSTTVISCDIPPCPGFKPSLSIVSVQTTNVPPKPNPVLVLSRMVSIDIPPEPMLRIDPHNASKPPDQPTAKPVETPFTLMDFMKCVKKSDAERKESESVGNEDEDNGAAKDWTKTLTKAK